MSRIRKFASAVFLVSLFYYWLTGYGFSTYFLDFVSLLPPILIMVEGRMIQENAPGQLATIGMFMWMFTFWFAPLAYFLHLSGSQYIEVGIFWVIMNEVLVRLLWSNLRSLLD